MGKKSKKKACKNFSPHPDRSNDNIKHTIDAIANCLKDASKEKLPLEKYFSRHKHSVGSCANGGEYNIMSMFVFNSRFTPSGAPERGFLSVICIRVHDNIRSTVILPLHALQMGYYDAKFQIGLNKTIDEYYDVFVKITRNDVGTGFRKAPYAQCSKLVNEALLRMNSMKKILNGHAERTIVRLFGLDSEDDFHKELVQLPQPAPAPDLESLCLTLNRPEHYWFHVNADLRDRFNCEAGEKDSITQRYLEKSLDYILKDEYRRERLHAMLNHAALFHMLERNEEEIASWLLWERLPMVLHPIGHEDTVAAMRNSAVLQLMINKFFKAPLGRLLPGSIPQFDEMNAYGEGCYNFLHYSKYVALRGGLPPAYIVTASIAESVGGAAEGSGGGICTENADNNALHDMERTMKNLKLRKTSCGVCGVTRRSDGTRLSQCSRCLSVAYCCPEHQKFDWDNGHKQQCTPPAG